MTFTDDNLKQLKEDGFLTPSTCEALLARLEAAEAVAGHRDDYCCDEERVLYEAWRKAAGK